MIPLLASVPALVADAAAQPVPLDRADAGIATRDQPRPGPAPRAPVPTPQAAGPGIGAVAVPGTPVARRIVVDGAPDLPADAFAAAVASFAGHRLSVVDLRELLATVSGVARAHGYLFAHSALPPQSLADGVLRVRLDEGRVDQIRLTGEQAPAVEALLRPLIGHAPRRAEVERRLALAADLPGVTLGRAEYRQENGRGVLTLSVRRDRVQASLLIDNRGFHELGPVRAQVAATLNGVTGDRDQLTLSALDTVAHPRQLAVLSGRYALRPDGAGTEVSLTGSWAHTAPGAELARYHITGGSGIEGLAVSRPLLRRSATSLWVSAGIDHFQIDQRLAGTLVRRDRLTTVNVAVRGTAPVAGGRANAGLGVTHGLDLFGATRAGSPLASRPDAGGRFTLFGAWANWARPVAGPLSVQAAVAAQLATRPLLAVEQLQIGGPTFGRAFDYAERSGDRGVLASVEFDLAALSRETGPLRQLTVYAFGDGGHVANLRNDLGTGSLASAGVGLRATVAFKLQAGLEAAFPLGARRFATGNHDPRLSFFVARAF